MCSLQSERYDLLACNTASSSGNVCVQSAILMRERRGGAETTALLLLLLPNKLRYHAARLLHTTVNKFAFASIWHDRAGSCFVTN